MRLLSTNGTQPFSPLKLASVVSQQHQCGSPCSPPEHGFGTQTTEEGHWGDSLGSGEAYRLRGKTLMTLIYLLKMQKVSQQCECSDPPATKECHQEEELATPYLKVVLQFLLVEKRLFFPQSDIKSIK